MQQDCAIIVRACNIFESVQVYDIFRWPVAIFE